MKIKLLMSFLLSITIISVLLVSCSPNREGKSVENETEAVGVIIPGVKLSATPSQLEKIESTAMIIETETPEQKNLEQPTPFFASFPDPVIFQWRQIADGLVRPVDIAFPPMEMGGGFFVVEQPGLIKFLNNGQISQNVVLDIRSRINSNDNEQGLLGIAFHPKFEENRLFFLNYTDLNGDTVISKFTMTSLATPSADPQSEEILLKIDQPYTNHNGGQIVFGPDGYLWIGLGDGGSAGDPQNYSQSNESLLGKMLRIDVDNGDPYAIPGDNPFVDGGGLSEIWATGLRNPWRFSFDNKTGNLFIADVGQNKWEEINSVSANSTGVLINFGWNLYEGNHTYINLVPGGNEDFIFSVVEYTRNDGCSVTGGYIYRGKDLPEFDGVYLYGDFCTGNIWGMIQKPDSTWEDRLLFSTQTRITSFGQDLNGELYLIDIGGYIYKLQRKD